MLSRTARMLVRSIAAAMMLMLGADSWAQQINLDAAKKEGKVVIYGTVVPKVMALIEKGFEAKYGIKTEYWRADATKVIDRVLTEWRAGKPGFDVVIGARGPLALAKRDNVYAKFAARALWEFHMSNIPDKPRGPSALRRSINTSPIRATSRSAPKRPIRTRQGPSSNTYVQLRDKKRSPRPGNLSWRPVFIRGLREQTRLCPAC